MPSAAGADHAGGEPAGPVEGDGRWYQIGSEMGRFKDKNDHDMVLAMTHEELVRPGAQRDPALSLLPVPD